jgi:hypothetical protein
MWNKVTKFRNLVILLHNVNRSHGKRNKSLAAGVDNCTFTARADRNTRDGKVPRTYAANQNKRIFWVILAATHTHTHTYIYIYISTPS